MKIAMAGVVGVVGMVGVMGVACAARGAVYTTIINQTAYSNGVGGEFSAQLFGAPFVPISLAGGGQFETFCVETSEQFQPGATYLATIETFSMGGSVGGQDPLDETAAFLYEAFITGTLPGYDYTNGSGLRLSQAGAVQNALWYIEGEVGSLDSPEAVAFWTFAQGGIGQGIGDVRVMRVFSIDADGNEVQAQDMLVMIPGPGGLAALGVAAVVLSRRRRA